MPAPRSRLRSDPVSGPGIIDDVQVTDAHTAGLAHHAHDQVDAVPQRSGALPVPTALVHTFPYLTMKP